ncbi:hypothetical protein L1987_19413 [Smallanthus sonchifolius]|uniref:Uncharacterized protein n=1 Tax=Smallanthus sonchifolius TaxID=185202 RepID=A0ACB9INL3_9ASTR|nr:hypothetical protein L1987_19413 [Smallanthus sonchifolius]
MVLREAWTKSQQSTRDVSASAKIGKILGERLLVNDIPAVSIVYKKDQRYHGKVRAFIDSVREAGIHGWSPLGRAISLGPPSDHWTRFIDYMLQGLINYVFTHKVINLLLFQGVSSNVVRTTKSSVSNHSISFKHLIVPCFSPLATSYFCFHCFYHLLISSALLKSPSFLFLLHH